MFVFALVKQSPKQSASRDPRWDRSKKVCVHACVRRVFWPRLLLRFHAFALLLFPSPLEMVPF